jgi:hypothetical protein
LRVRSVSAGVTVRDREFDRSSVRQRTAVRGEIAGGESRGVVRARGEGNVRAEGPARWFAAA